MKKILIVSILLCSLPRFAKAQVVDTTLLRATSATTFGINGSFYPMNSVFLQTATLDSNRVGFFSPYMNRTVVIVKPYTTYKNDSCYCVFPSEIKLNWWFTRHMTK